MAESEEDLKILLKKVKEESEKVGLKLNIQKTKIMASGPITSWEIDRETVERVSDFIFLGSQITADSDCSHEIKMICVYNTFQQVTSLFPVEGSGNTGGKLWCHSFFYTLKQEDKFAKAYLVKLLGQ